VKLRCSLMSLLRIHHPDCQYCKAREAYGIEMRKRLEELNWRVQANVSNFGDDAKRIEGIFYAEPVQVITLPVSLKGQKKTA
jgi:hypothetical protein